MSSRVQMHPSKLHASKLHASYRNSTGRVLGSISRTLICCAVSDLGGPKDDCELPLLVEAPALPRALNSAASSHARNTVVGMRLIILGANFVHARLS